MTDLVLTPLRDRSGRRDPDGISLTVVEAGETSFTVSLIPETLARTVTAMVDLPGFADVPHVPWLTRFRARDEPPLSGSPAEVATVSR